jgi:hypothetical protein
VDESSITQRKRRFNEGILPYPMRKNHETHERHEKGTGRAVHGRCLRASGH